MTVVRIAMMLMVLVLTGLMGNSPQALGQYAPAGNTHPQTKFLAEEGVENPFGQASSKSTVDAAAKHAFAQRVNLEGLRTLSLYHNGRIKILGTLANETIAEITGRRSFQDISPEYVGDEKKYRKVTYDPTFTFLDMIIDPGFYHDKPLIGVTYLPLRKRLLDEVFTAENSGGAQHAEEVRETWLRVGRLTPEWVSKYGPGLSNVPTSDQQIQRGLGDLHESMQMFVKSATTLKMVPTKNKDAEWLHLSTLDVKHPVRVAALELGSAWRAGDAEKVNKAIDVLVTQLPSISPEMYPTVRRNLEAFYNRANLFEWGTWAYAVSMLTLLLAMGTGRNWLRYTGLMTLLVAVGVHFAGFALRCYIAERYTIQNQFESMTGVSLFAAFVGLGLLLVKRQMIFAAAAAGVGFLVLVTATQTGIPGKDINREAAILNTSVLLKYHVTTVLFSYGLISLGMIISLFYLARHYAQAFRLGGAPAATMVRVGAAGGDGEASATGVSGHARAMLDLDKAQMTILQLAFWTLGVGILLGAWWADHSWGRWWAFDPKELWALVTWIVYLIVVHLRVSQGVRDKGLVTAWLSVVGFVIMLWCYFGVNLLLPGLHAYA